MYIDCSVDCRLYYRQNYYMRHTPCPWDMLQASMYVVLSQACI